MELTEQQIKEALDKAYKEAGSNAYFGEGFKAGVKFVKGLIKDTLAYPEKYVEERIAKDTPPEPIHDCTKLATWRCKATLTSIYGGNPDFTIGHLYYGVRSNSKDAIARGEIMLIDNKGYQHVVSPGEWKDYFEKEEDLV